MAVIFGGKKMLQCTVHSSFKKDGGDKGNGEKGGSTKELVSTARPEDSTVRLDVSTANPIAPPTTTRNIKDSLRPGRSILTLKPLPTIDPKDKGKGVLEETEPAKKMTRSDLDAAQISKDAKVARLVYEEELAELEREKEKRQREEEASKAAIAEIPPTKSQLRNLMMTYLKNMGGYKHFQLKAKTFVEIQGLYKRQKKVIDDFKPMDSDDAVDKEKVLEEPDSTKIKVKFDRMDLEELYNLVMQRFETNSPDGEEKAKTGTNIDEDTNYVVNKGSYTVKVKVINTKAEGISVVGETLNAATLTDERKYTLTKETLKRMLALRLIAESESEAVFDLLRFIQN
uniref:Uncharacterized protein n=1 Tax=Tanacetum cinerariifolium TaxID=118510 RepID=A0A699ITA0_TANCI|nr:hypothetical protein [Tanacetum cinerariifolium]